MNRKIHTKFASTAAVLLGAALLLSGCGDTTTPGQSPAATTSADTGGGYAAPSPTDTAMAAADLKTAETSLGTVVVDGKGMTLYYFTKDTKGTTTSACTGECLAAWPIAVASGDTPVLEGVTGEVGTIDSPDGAKQLTLNGMPLYYFAKDTKPGDVNGQGVNDVWYVVSPAGEMIK
ncbi:hypothetical protein ACIPVK_02600 [Paeniglutamicibacter sp. MACA_103]|uniref:hypothetical protein n=1 Tax=Paeniglutamicibacter sp. MACA_103 TaxID=3377337 RepID=UPI003892FC6B